MSIKPQQQRGSILILAVVVLVIIALLGMGFVQQRKMDRYATERYGRNYMDIVINGILGELNQRLKEDIDDGGLAPNHSGPLYDYPWTDPSTASGYIEAFGYDGAKIGNGSGDKRDDHYLASTAPIILGTGDDQFIWPHITNLTGVWLDLPEVETGPQTPGIEIVDYSSQYRSDAWAEGGNAAPEGLGYAPAGYQRRGADADGDGLLDSRWQWAPISVRDIGGRKFVMALRMVDLSALVNVNTATPLMNLGDAESSGTPLPLARGYSPTDLDLSRLLARVVNATEPEYTYDNSNVIGPYSDGLEEEMNWLFDYRTIGGNVTSISIPLGTDDRYNPFTTLGVGVTADPTGMWPQQAALYGDNALNFLSGDEIELRFRGGLNNPHTLSPLETYLPRGTRNWNGADPTGATSEGQWKSVDPDAALTVGQWFYGITSAADLHLQTVESREFPGVRHMLTTMSGHSVYGSYIGPGPSAQAAKVDLAYRAKELNDPSGGGYSQYLDDLRKQIETAFKNPWGTPGSWYRGIGDPNAMDAIIDEYRLALIDYMDENSAPTEFTIGGTQYYGLEKLPFIREVYVQALYDDKDEINNLTGAPGSDTPPIFDTWRYDEAAHGDTRAMAIELGNPFSTEIVGEDLLVEDSGGGYVPMIRVVVVQRGTAVSNWEFGRNINVASGTSEDYARAMRIPGRDDGSGDDTLIIYSPPESATADGDTNHPGEEDHGTPDPASANLFSTDLGVSGVSDERRAELAAGTLFFNVGSGEITIQLQVRNWQDDNGNNVVDPGEIAAGPDEWVPYDEFQTGIVFEDGIVHGPNATPEDPSPQHGQYVAYRDSRDINFLLTEIAPTRGEGFDWNQRNMGSEDYSAANDAEEYRFPGSTEIVEFGEDNKGPSIPTATLEAEGLMFNGDSSFQLHLPDRPMFSAAELGWVYMLGFTRTETFPQRLANSDPEARFLDIDPDPAGIVADGGAGLNTVGVPHAAILMDLFSTVTPRHDNLDNNDNGTTDDDEFFVPGTINVNTATLPVLTLAASLGGEEIVETEALMRTIVAYRDQPTQSLPKFYAPGSIPPLNARTNARISSERRETPGVASLGELLFMNPDLGGGAPSSLFDMQYYAEHPTEMTTANDLYPAPDTANAEYVQLGGDAESRLARFQQLAQNFTVRSDRFAVYGIVRAYTNNGFNQTPVEEAQFIAILDRGGMLEGTPPTLTGNVKVVAFYRLK